MTFSEKAKKEVAVPTLHEKIRCCCQVRSLCHPIPPRMSPWLVTYSTDKSIIPQHTFFVGGAAPCLMSSQRMDAFGCGVGRGAGTAVWRLPRVSLSRIRILGLFSQLLVQFVQNPGRKLGSCNKQTVI